jgi:hypothetical protein
MSQMLSSWLRVKTVPVGLSGDERDVAAVFMYGASSSAGHGFRGLFRPSPLLRCHVAVVVVVP